MTVIEPHVVVLGAGTKWPDKGVESLSHGFVQTFCTDTVGADTETQNTAMLNVLSANLKGKVRVSMGKVMADIHTGSAQSFARGLVWAAELYPEIVVIPLGLLKPNSSIKAALEILANTNCRIYAAVGNALPEQTGSLYPAAYPECIAVGSLSQSQVYQSWATKPDVLIDESVVANVKGMKNIQMGTATATMLAVAEYLNHEHFNGQAHYNRF